MAAGDLVETMRFDPVEGLCRLERHLARLKAAAGGFGFDRHAARNALQAATFRLDDPACVRLLVARSGLMAIETRALPAPAGPVTIAIVTGARATAAARRIGDDPHAAARAAADAFDILFADADGALGGGSLVSLFVPRGDRLLTPPGGAGLLRADLIESGRAEVATLTVSDLAHGFLVGNSLLGLVPATLAPTKKNPDPRETRL